MKRLLAATAVVALVAGGAAIAQSADTSGSTDTTLGSQVKVLAQGQKDSDTKGIGSQVSTMAHERNAARAAARTDTGDDNDDTDSGDVDTDNDDNTAVTTATAADAATDASFGSQVKALAQGQRTSDTHDIGAQVSAMAHDRNDARLAARQSVSTDIRTSHADVQIAANTAADARAAGQAARDAAMTVRDSAKDARDNASAVRDAAHSIRDAVKAARPGH